MLPAQHQLLMRQRARVQSRIAADPVPNVTAVACHRCPSRHRILHPDHVRTTLDHLRLRPADGAAVGGIAGVGRDDVVRACAQVAGAARRRRSVDCSAAKGDRTAAAEGRTICSECNTARRRTAANRRSKGSARADERRIDRVDECRSVRSYRGSCTRTRQWHLCSQKGWTSSRLSR